MKLKAKVKRIQISPEAMMHVMAQGTAWRVSEGVPAGAKFRGCTLDPYTQIVYLFVEHESFPEIEVASVIPILETEFQKIR